MSREELIKAIYDNDDAWSCLDYHCDKPEEEGNTGECCLKCAEKQLKAYEDKIRADVLDKIETKILGNCASMLKDGERVIVIRQDIFKFILKELKEQKKCHISQ